MRCDIYSHVLSVHSLLPQKYQNYCPFQRQRCCHCLSADSGTTDSTHFVIAGAVVAGVVVVIIVVIIAIVCLRRREKHAER